MAKQTHSKAYHRYFENYAERSTMDEKGNPVIQRVYVGQYYRARLTDGQHKTRKAILLVLYLISAILCLYGGLTAPATGARLAAIATMLSLLFIILLGITVFYRLTAPREMEIRIFRDSSQRLKGAAVASAVFLLFSAGALIASVHATEVYGLSENLPGILSFAAAGVLCILIAVIEHRTAYDILPPKQERPEGSSPIRFEAPE